MARRLTRTATFPGQLKNLAKIGKFVVKAAKAAGLDDKAIYAVELAVEEAASNIIEHAYAGKGIGKIDCTCHITSDGLTIVLRDNGYSFDPKSVPELDINVPLIERLPGGAGLHLIHQLMDEVEFTSTPDGKNVLTMFKRK